MKNVKLLFDPLVYKVDKLINEQKRVIQLVKKDPKINHFKKPFTQKIQFK